MDIKDKMTVLGEKHRQRGNGRLEKKRKKNGLGIKPGGRRRRGVCVVGAGGSEHVIDGK